MKNRHILLALAATLSLNCFPLALEVTPGQLAEGLKTLDPNVSTLSITGTIDARDLGALKSLPPSVRKLQLTEARIVAYEGEVEAFPNQSLFKANELPPHLFFGADLDLINLPATVKVAGEGVCANSAVKEVSVPDGIEEIGPYAFYGCANLLSFRAPASLRSIGTAAFGNCTSLQNMDLQRASLLELPDKMAAGAASLSTLTLPSSLQELGSEVFQGTPLVEISIPGLRKAAPYALAGMPMLTTVVINGDASLGEGFLMDDPSLTTVSGNPKDLPDLFLANSPQADGKAIVEGAQSIGRYSLAYNQADTLLLSKGLAKIGDSALTHTPNLTYIDARPLEAELPEVSERTFAGVDQPNVVLHVTPESADAWTNHPQWGLFKIDSSPTGVDSLTASQAGSIRIALSNGLLVVEAPSAIASCRVWDPDGRCLLAASSALNRLEADASRLPSGLAVVSVLSASGESHTVKILIP